MKSFKYVNFLLKTLNRDLNVHLASPSFNKQKSYINKIRISKDIREFSKTIPISDVKVPNDRVDKASKESGLDGWFEKWIENLKSNQNFQTDWKDEDLFREMKDRRLNYHNILLSRLSHHTQYIAGLYENASSLCDYIEERDHERRVHPNNLMIKAFRIFLRVHQKQDHEEAIKLFKQLCAEHEYLFDPITCGVLISAVSKTSIWKECLMLLKVHAMMQKPQPAVLSYVMAAALKHQDSEVFEALVDQLEGQLPALSFVEEVLKICEVEMLFRLTNTHSWVLTDKMADMVVKHVSKYSTGVLIDKVKINKRKCPKCGASLASNPGLSDGEMDELRKEFMRRVFVRKGDMYLSSTPEEIDKFKRFLDHAPNYDVVIDSLNVVYMLNPTQKADVVMRRLIEEFLKEDKKILVLSRKHLKHSLISSISFNKKDVRWFFAGNRSHDDLFALYACFHGNNGCTLVTKDQLRNYSFQLGGRVSKLFVRWQERHQIIFNGMHHKTNRLLFRDTIEHDTKVQWSDDGSVIHVPCKQTSASVASYDRANFWLCMQKTTNADKSRNNMNKNNSDYNKGKDNNNGIRMK